MASLNEIAGFCMRRCIDIAVKLGYRGEIIEENNKINIRV